MDKLLALKAFVDVAETGGFSKAARRVGMATSSVTRLMDSLEESLGSALFTRTTRHVTLTDAGASYLEQVTQILSDLEEADGSVFDGGAEPSGPLKVSAPVTYARLYIGPHLGTFLARYPKVSLDLVVSDAFVDLAADRFDLAVRIGVPENQPNLIVRKLEEHHRLVVASPAYLKARGEPTSPEQLRDHDCLRFSYQPGPQRWSFSRGEEVSVDIGGRLAANSSDILRDAALEGHGIALLAQWLVGEDVRSGRLKRLFADYGVNPHDQSTCVYAAYLPNRRYSRKVHAFLEFLQQHVMAPTND